MLLAFCLGPRASAQELRATNVLSRSFDSGGNVVELDVPEGLDGKGFGIVWVAADGTRGGTWHVARGGRHCYEVRDHPEWEGRIQLVAVTLDGVPGRTRRPTFRDELDIFLDPNRIRPSTVNFLAGHTLFGRRWEALLLALTFGAGVVLTVCRRQTTTSLVWSFMIAWGAMDLRSTWDHLAAVLEVEARNLDLPPLMSARPFVDRAAEIVGGDTWSVEPLTGVVQSYVRYRLAEKPFVPLEAAAKSVFLITQQPGEGQLVYQLGEFRLLRRGRR